MRTSDHEVVQFDGPVLELMRDGRSRFDQRLARLGPDVLDDEFDAAKFLRRLREDDQTRQLGDALLDQRIVAGLGNIWRAEGCFDAGIDPWRKLEALSDDEALAVITAVRPRMLESAGGKGFGSGLRVYKRHTTPCRRCGTTIQARGQGDDNRTTYWCPACQR
jgi:endonuclease-8